jgi:hypothetical protein
VFKSPGDDPSGEKVVNHQPMSSCEEAVAATEGELRVGWVMQWSAQDGLPARTM